MRRDLSDYDLDYPVPDEPEGYSPFRRRAKPAAVPGQKTIWKNPESTLEVLAEGVPEEDKAESDSDVN